MYNPFKESQSDHQSNLMLVQSALEGNRDGLEKLILRHQAWIFNIAFKMISNRDDAEDITQEILIKMITKLSTYKPEKSAFRTWLYRITLNHVLNMKKRQQEENRFDLDNFDGFATILNQIPENNPKFHPENNALIEESKASCLNGMLLCLNRKQRLVFILGDVFGVSGAVGSEIMEISAANFRKILSRSREKIYNFLNEKCGLIDENNPCRCVHFLKIQTHLGKIDPDKPAIQHPHLGSINEVIKGQLKEFEEMNLNECNRLFRDQPFYKPSDITGWLHNAIKNSGISQSFSADSTA